MDGVRKSLGWHVARTWSYSRERWTRYRDPFGLFEMVWGQLCDWIRLR